MYIFLASYYTYWSYKCFYTHFLDHTVRLFVFRKKIPKLDFSPNRFGNFGIIQYYVYLKIKRNFPNSTYNRMSMYNRKLRVSMWNPLNYYIWVWKSFFGAQGCKISANSIYLNGSGNWFSTNLPTEILQLQHILNSSSNQFLKLHDPTYFQMYWHP